MSKRLCSDVIAIERAHLDVKRVMKGMRIYRRFRTIDISYSLTMTTWSEIGNLIHSKKTCWGNLVKRNGH